MKRKRRSSHKSDLIWLHWVLCIHCKATSICQSIRFRNIKSIFYTFHPNVHCVNNGMHMESIFTRQYSTIEHAKKRAELVKEKKNSLPHTSVITWSVILRFYSDFWTTRHSIHPFIVCMLQLSIHVIYVELVWFVFRIENVIFFFCYHFNW